MLSVRKKINTNDIDDIVNCIVENNLKSINGTKLFIDGRNFKSIF